MKKNTERTTDAYGVMALKPSVTSFSWMKTNPSVERETAKMRTIAKHGLGLLFATLATPGIADDNPIPPVPEGGLMLMMEGTCTDIETQVEGYCVMSQDRQGNIYVMFAIDGELWEIRQVVGDTYEVIWRRTPGELL